MQNDFCKNCKYLKSKHRRFNNIILDIYDCPCDDTETRFYNAVNYVPMTNLEYLEYLYEAKLK